MPIIHQLLRTSEFDQQNKQFQIMQHVIVTLLDPLLYC